MGHHYMVMLCTQYCQSLSQVTNIVAPKELIDHIHLIYTVHNIMKGVNIIYNRFVCMPNKHY